MTPGAPCRSQLTSGARERGLRTGPGQCVGPSCHAAGDIQGGARASRRIGEYVLLQEERQAREGTERAGVCLQMSLMHLSSSGLCSASGLKINFHREGVLSSWAFLSVPAKHSVLRLQQSP